MYEKTVFCTVYILQSQFRLLNNMKFFCPNYIFGSYEVNIIDPNFKPYKTLKETLSVILSDSLYKRRQCPIYNSTLYPFHS